MARTSSSSLITGRIRSSCESPTMCWAFCYRENLCGISESKELLYDLVIIKGTRLVSEAASVFSPFFGLLWTKVCAWLFWFHPLLPGATGRHPKRALNFPPPWRQLCISHFTSSHLCTAAQPETGWGVLQRFAVAHPTPFNCGHHGEDRKELSICVAITQPILFSVKENCSELLPLQYSEIHLKFWIDLTRLLKENQQFQDAQWWR